MRRMVLCMLLVGAVARAEGPSEGDKARGPSEAEKARGKAIWSEGITRYDLGDFDDAIRKFEEAYRSWPNPNILFNLGQANRQRKAYERAVFYFHAYLRNKPEAANRAVVEQLIKELDVLIAAQKASGERPPQDVQGPVATAPSTAPAAPSPPSPEPARSWYE